MNLKRITTFIIFFLLLGSLNYVNGSLVETDDFIVVAENKYLKLFIHESTTEIAVFSKVNNNFWYSNPLNREKEERIARGSARDLLNSQFSITYYTPGDIRRRMDNYSESVSYGQYDITKINNGIRIDYLLGSKWDDQSYLPVLISQERFTENILMHIEKESEKELILQQYELVSLVEMPEGYEREDVFDINKEEVFGKYTLLDLNNRLSKRQLIELVVDTIVENRTDVNKRSDISFEDIKPFIKNPTLVKKRRIARWDLDDMLEIIKGLGYTPLETQHAHIMYNIIPPEPNLEVFTVPMEYILDDNNLVTRIPVNEIEYPKGEVSYPLHSISVLPYFGAASQEQDGYMFVPDGSGALIYNNNEKLNASPLNLRVYGIDKSLRLQEQKSRFTQQVYLPIFGVKKDKQAFLAIIEEGESLANIRADISGRTNSYNNVFSEFTIVPVSELELLAVSAARWLDSINIYSEDIYQGDIQIRYAFMDEQPSYVGMANYYRKYLKNNYGLRKNQSQESIPLYLELIGAINLSRPVLGIPRRIQEPITDYKQVVQLAQEVIDGGISNIKIRYNGWLEGGLEHIFPQKAYIEKSLGGEKDFINMLNIMEEMEIDFFPEVNFLNINKLSFNDGFNIRQASSRYLNREVAKIYNYNIADYSLEEGNYQYLLSPSRLKILTDKFINDYKYYPVNGISLGSMGEQVYSDYNLNKFIDRQESKNIIEEVLESIKNNKLNIMADGVNSFVLPYVNNVLNIPLKSSEFDLIDESIPFYQMVIRGYINYAGPPLNFSKNPQIDLLKTVETGGSLYYKWFYSKDFVAKDTDFNYLYSAYYQDWIEHAFETYSIVNPVLSQVEGEKIINHQLLYENVYKTTFESGLAVIVNYNKYEVEINGVIIGERSFKLIGGEKK